MIKFTINSKDILDLCKDEQESAKRELFKAVGNLAQATESHIMEMAKTELSPALQKIFKGQNGESNLQLDTISPGTHVITLSGSAYWIEEGIPPNTDMKTSSWLI